MKRIKWGALAVVGTLFVAGLSLTGALTTYADDEDIDLAQEEEEEEVFTSADGLYTYTLDEDSLAIKRYQGSGEDALIIPDTLDGYTVTELLGGAIVGHSELTSITIPASLEKINDSCFYGCTSLESFVVEDGSDAYMTVDDVLYTADGLRLICYPLGLTATSFAVPDGVVEIWSSSFAQTPLVDVTFPDSLLYIDDWAFAYTPLTAVDFPSGLIEIGDDAFIYCSALTQVTFPESLETIGAEAFAACDNLASIELNEGLLTVNQSAFAGTAMQEVTIPESVETIGFSAFGYEADTVTAVDDFIIYGVSGSEAQTYCTASDEENDYENNFTFRSVISDIADEEEATQVEVTTQEESFFDQYGMIIFIVCVVVILIVAALILLIGGRGKKKDKKDKEKDNNEVSENESEA